MDVSGRQATGARIARLDDHPTGRAPSAPRPVDPAAIARRLGAVVHWPGAAGVVERSWQLIARAPDFDAWLIAWPCGGTAELHDHGGSRGALHVLTGSLVEATPRRDAAGKVTLARREVPSGATLAFGPGHVHDVQNEAAAAALSVHVYSPPLTTMRYYDRLGDRLIPRESGWAPSQDRASTRNRSVVRFAAR